MLFYERIKKYEYKLNDTEDMIVEYILKNKEEVVKLSIQTLADRLFTVPNSIIRLCKKIDYDGFSQLKNSLKEELKETNKEEKTGFELNIKKTIELLDYQIIDKVVDIIYKSKKILLYGTGQNTPLCEIFVKELKAKEKNISFYSQRHEAIYNSSKLTNQDLVFLISLSGETAEIIEIAKICKQNNCRVVALTNTCENKLQSISDISLYCYTTLSKVNGYNIQDNIPFMIVLRAIIERYWLIY